MDLYTVLGVREDATFSQIREAYRWRALRSHPDLNRDKLDAAEREMVDLNVAAWVLTNPELRWQYDRSRCRRASARPRAWYDQVCYGAADWVVPAEPRRPRVRSAELVELLRRIRLWPGRALLRVSEWSDGLSRRQRTTLTAACLMLAVCLISYAKPRSLTKLFAEEPQQTLETQTSGP